MRDILVNIREEKTTHRHHCIPQFYLKQFAVEQDSGKFITNIYNKNKGIKFLNITDNIGFVEDYNTTIINGVESDKFEQLHNLIFEKKSSKLFYRILHKINKHFKELKIINCLSIERRKELLLNPILCIEEKYFLSMLLSYFILRTKKIRYSMEELTKQCKIIYEDIGKVNNIYSSEMEDKFYKQFDNEITRKNNYIAIPFDYELLTSTIDIIYSHKWCIAYNDTNELIYASDNVYGIDCLCPHFRARGVGFNTYGNVIIFPLSSKICIFMIDSKCFFDITHSTGDCFTELLDIDSIKNINEKMVLSGSDEVYSQDGNWATLDATIKKYNIPLGHKPYKVC